MGVSLNDPAIRLGFSRSQKPSSDKGVRPLNPPDFYPRISMPDAQEATWVDRAETQFDVTLEYEYFPFDNQLLDTGNWQIDNIWRG